MTVKELMFKYRCIEKEKQFILEEIGFIKYELLFSNDAYNTIEDLQQRYDKLNDKSIKIEDTFYSLLEILSSRLEDYVICQHLLHGVRLNVLAEQLHYSNNYIYNLHSKALKKLEKEYINHNERYYPNNL